MLINCGLHDVKRCKKTDVYQVDIETYASNVRQIIGAARRLARQMVWLRTTAVDDEAHAKRLKFGFHRYQKDIDQYNAVADQVMADEQITVIDIATFTQTCLLPDDIDRYTDGVHFSPMVQAQQGAWLAGHLSAMT